MTQRAENEFLNIKQAAAFLNVSEVSLRRWTNAGSLGCLRVGAKRERRFRREDLIAFLARDGAPFPPQPALSGVVLEGIPIETGSHLCSIYRDDRGRLKLAVPFLADGLANGQACFLVAPARSRDRILESLRRVRPQIEADIKAERLVVSGGAASVDELREWLADRFVAALHDGAIGLRLLGDMTWHRDHGLDDDALMAFESDFQRSLGRRYPLVALCQYDVRAYSGLGILNALECHQDTFRLPTARFLN